MAIKKYKRRGGARDESEMYLNYTEKQLFAMFRRIKRKTLEREKEEEKKENWEKCRLLKF